jgi:O-methyltransferase
MDTSALEIVLPFTKSSRDRLEAMACALAHIDETRIGGDIVECGIWRGGNIILARKLSPLRTCWLYDTFTGMNEPGPDDISKAGLHARSMWPGKAGKWAAASLEEVRGILAETGTLDDALLRFVVGPVEQTLLYEANLPERIALLRLDTDWYASTKIELEVLWPRVVSGGVLIVDDYGHWMGARKAVNDYFNFALPFQWIDYTAIRMTKP